MNKAIIISEKYCDGNPSYSVSDNESVSFKPLKLSGLFKEVKHLFIDLVDINIELQKPENRDADLYYFVFFGNSNLNPSPKTISELPGKKIFAWPDTVWPWIYETIQSINKYASLHIAYDLPSNELIEYCKPIRMLYLGHPLDPEYFITDKVEEKIYDISFIGTIYPPRDQYLLALITNKNLISNQIKRDLNLYIGTGSRSNQLTKEKYASILRKSKIGLNFSISPTGKDQLKGRAHEVLASNTLLLQNRSDETAKIYDRDKHYIEFTSINNMLDKLVYYISHEKERLAISSSGYNFIKENYNHNKIWNRIISLINEV